MAVSSQLSQVTDQVTTGSGHPGLTVGGDHLVLHHALAQRSSPLPLAWPYSPHDGGKRQTTGAKSQRLQTRREHEKPQDRCQASVAASCTLRRICADLEWLYQHADQFGDSILSLSPYLAHFPAIDRPRALRSIAGHPFSKYAREGRDPRPPTRALRAGLFSCAN